MRSIIIVSSEMQLYNAIEAIEYFKCSKNTLLVSNYTNRNKRILKQLEMPQIFGKFDTIRVMNTFNLQGRISYYVFNLFAIIRIFILSFFHRYDYVMIGNYTDVDENRRAVKHLLEKYSNRIIKVELIKEHNLGEMKYQSLGMEMFYKGVDDNLMNTYKAELDDIGVPVEICKI